MGLGAKHLQEDFPALRNSFTSAFANAGGSLNSHEVDRSQIVGGYPGLQALELETPEDAWEVAGWDRARLMAFIATIAKPRSVAGVTLILTRNQTKGRGEMPDVLVLPRRGERDWTNKQRLNPKRSSTKKKRKRTGHQLRKFIEAYAFGNGNAPGRHKKLQDWVECVHHFPRPEMKRRQPGTNSFQRAR